MIISNLEKQEHDGLVRICADVHWEATDQPDRTVYVETVPAFTDSLTVSPDAFLVGCLVPAMFYQEHRIRIDGAICPYLVEGLGTAMALLGLWTDGRLAAVAIEADRREKAAFPDRPQRAGLFLSGGIDSLAALRRNRLDYPATHPASIQDGLLVHGFDIGGVISRGAKHHVFDRAREHMAVVAEDAGLELIQVYTNFRHLCDLRELWLNSFFGAVLAAVGHAFAKRLDRVYIGSSYDLPHLHPCGSHPLLDPEYASIDLAVRHKDAAMSRMDKHRLVADWPVAFDHFRVCLANVPDRLNCGVCEKCTRTRTELVALGLLDKTRAFVENDVTPEELLKYDITIRGRDVFYRDMIRPLTDRGRLDLVQAIRQALEGLPPR